MQSTYQKLEVWQCSIELADFIYKLVKDFPRDEIYGLSDQMRRAAVSVSSNIAEGSQRSSKKQFAYYVDISLGSSAELETQLILAQRFGFIYNKEIFDMALDILLKVRKMLVGLRRKLLCD